MTDKQIIIDDQKKTIHRLQQECTEKTNIILALGDKLKCKEQECEELKNIINEAKNSKLDLKSFLVGEAVQNEYEQQLDQLKFDNKILNSTISSLEETRDILANKIDQLKAENEKLEEQLELNTANAVVIDMVERLYKLKQALKEIKEIAEKIYDECEYSCFESCAKKAKEQILQKISEVKDE